MGKTKKEYDSPLGKEKLVERKFLLIPEDSLRFNNLTFVRSLLAVMVVFSHCFVIFYGTEEEVEPFFIWSNGQLSMGTFAVYFFFVISGFLVLLSWDKTPQLGNYFWKRFLRVYPAFLVVSLICLFIFGPLGTGDYFKPFGYWVMYFENLDWSLIPTNILLLQEPQAPWVFKNSPISDSLNWPVWTIKYEFACYILVPILYFLGILKRRMLVLLLFLVVYGSLAYQRIIGSWFFGWETYDYIGRPDMFMQFLMFFCAGMVFYVFRDAIPRNRNWLLVSVIMLISSMFFYEGLLFTLPVFGSYALFHFSFARSYSLIGLAKWGDFSYGIYLFAWPIQQLLLHYFERYIDIPLFLILSVSGSLVFAFVSWHYVESRALRYKDFYFRKKKVELKQTRLVS